MNKANSMTDKKPKRKMPSLENERSRRIGECARGQNLEVRKACFAGRDPTKIPGYNFNVDKKSKKKSKKR